MSKKVGYACTVYAKHIRSTGSLSFILFAQSKHLEKINTVLLTFASEWEEVQGKIHPCARSKINPWPRPHSMQSGSWTTTTEGLTLMTQHMAFQKARFCETSIQDYLNPGLQDIQLIDPGLAQSTFLKWNVFWASIQDWHNSRFIANSDPAFWIPS